MTEETIKVFLPPSAGYLVLEEGRLKWDDILRYPWEKPKVLLNAHRTSRGVWRYAAFIDKEGIISLKNFIAIWPNKQDDSIEYLAAILNSPLANAFVTAHERSRDNRVKTIRNIPVPELSYYDKQSIDQLVQEYMTQVQQRILSDNAVLRDVLLQIDAIILKGYNLPPRWERELLDYFRDEPRPVPFEFNEYIPESFTACFPLLMYISPDFKQCTAENLLKQTPRITDPVFVKILEEVE